MARLLRVEFPGAIYHVSYRMVGEHAPGAEDWPAERRLFRDDRDYGAFLDRLAERVETYEIRLYLFACMVNHVHLVFETPKGNCGRFMQSLSTAYTVYYNRRYRRHGHLLDGRYKARLVDDARGSDLETGASYLLSLSRYVHLNPVRVARLAREPLETRVLSLNAYRWSSYHGYVGLAKPLCWVDYPPILGQMSGRKKEWPGRYREFVESGVAKDDDEFAAALWRSRHAIGCEDFRLRVRDLYRTRLANCECPEDVALRHVGSDLPVERILSVLAAALEVDEAAFKGPRRNSPLRAIAARCLVRYGGLTQRDAAHVLGCRTGAAVSIQLSTLEQRLGADARLQKRVQRLEQNLQTERVKRSRVAKAS